jgi:hypothetical protein
MSRPDGKRCRCGFGTWACEEGRHHRVQSAMRERRSIGGHERRNRATGMDNHAADVDHHQ